MEFSDLWYKFLKYFFTALKTLKKQHSYGIWIYLPSWLQENNINYRAELVYRTALFGDESYQSRPKKNMKP